MISFKGAHVPKPVIMFAVHFYLRYGVSYRDLEEIMAEPGVTIDHGTLNRWGVKDAPGMAGLHRSGKRRPRSPCGWMRRTSTCGVTGCISSALSTGMAKHLISCRLKSAIHSRPISAAPARRQQVHDVLISQELALAGWFSEWPGMRALVGARLCTWFLGTLGLPLVARGARAQWLGGIFEVLLAPFALRIAGRSLRL